MSNNAIHDRIATIARQEFAQLYASVEDQAEAMAAAVMTGLREDGCAVVELPEPDANGDFGFGVTVDEGEVLDPEGETCAPSFVRQYAAALLAAANTAERAE